MWNFLKRHLKVEEKGEERVVSNGHGPWRFSTALLTDVGCQRPLNEDSGRLIQDPKGLLAVVADGMGGHNAGEKASQIAVDTICRLYYETQGSASQILSAAMAAANEAVYECAAADERLSGMGTTCTALAIADGFAYVAHIGDTRLYLIRDGEIYQMTEDHTYVMEMVRRGVISADQAREHPDRNVLHRALGRRPEVEIYSWAEGAELKLGDRYLLCSDGLSGQLRDETIARVALEQDPGNACATLIDLTRQTGAPDNVTVGIVRVDDASDGAELPPTREFPMQSRENEEREGGPEA